MDPRTHSMLAGLRTVCSEELAAGFPEGKVSPEVIERSLALEYRWQGRYQPAHWWRRTHEIGQREYYHWAALRRTWLAFREEFERRYLEGIAQGKPQHALLEEIGAEIVARIKDAILGVHYPPLAPRTIELKRKKPTLLGPEKPLVETGELLNSVTYVVRSPRT